MRRAVCFGVVALVLIGLWAWLEAIPQVPEWAAWLVVGVGSAAVLGVMVALCDGEEGGR